MKVYLYCTKSGGELLGKNGKPLNGTVCAVATVEGVTKWSVYEWEDDDGEDENGKPIILRGIDIMRDFRDHSRGGSEMRRAFLKGSCLSERELYRYVGYKDGSTFYGWHIESVEEIKHPIKLGCRPPQSWQMSDDGILMSIKPKWLGKILLGEKTIEVRKTAPSRLVNYRLDFKGELR